MFFSTGDLEAFYASLDGNGAGDVEMVLSSVDVRNASATVPADRDMIFEQISDGAGFEEFNKHISEAMRSSFRGLAMRRALDGFTQSMSFRRTSKKANFTQAYAQAASDSL